MKLESKDRLIFRILLNQFHGSKSDLFLKNVPTEFSKKILEETLPATNALLLLKQSNELVNEVHYSWLLEAFKKFPDRLKGPLLSVLPTEIANGISKTFNIPIENLSLAPSMKRFLINDFFKKFERMEILPLEFLEPNPLSCLSEFTKTELVRIIDYLGIYDLAEEVRHIIEKNLIKTLYAAIPEKKLHFLKTCLNQKEKLVTPRLDLTQWNLKKDSLEKLLHKRGLIRLSHALSGQSKDFVWHLIHKLDIGRGKIIEAHYSEEEIPLVSKALCQQVMNVINFLNKKSLP